MTEETYSTGSGEAGGKLAFIIGFLFSLVNVINFLATTDLSSTDIHISIMDIVSAIIMIISAVFGIPFAYYKLRIAHHDYVERKEDRKKKGEKPIRFRFKFWKSWGSKKK